MLHYAKACLQILWSAILFLTTAVCKQKDTVQSAQFYISSLRWVLQLKYGLRFFVWVYRIWVESY